MRKKIVAGIVSYNPDVDRFLENIDHIILQVDMVIVFDNASHNVNDFTKAVEGNPHVHFIKNKSNNGIAYALNRIFEYASRNGYEWVITLDQDSIVAKDLVDKFQDAVTSDRIAVVCPFIIDSRRKYMKYEYHKPTDELDMCITSGSMTRIRAWKEAGGFDEWLFIDLVDNDFCKRLRIAGHKIIRVNSVLLNQEFGRIEPKAKFWCFFYIKLGELLHNTNIQKFSYKKTVDPRRVYYTNRNVIYLNKKFKNHNGIGYRENYHCDTYAGFMLYFSFGSLLRGKNKFRIAKSILLGIRDGRVKARKTRPIA